MSKPYKYLPNYVNIGRYIRAARVSADLPLSLDEEPPSNMNTFQQFYDAIAGVRLVKINSRAPTGISRKQPLKIVFRAGEYVSRLVNNQVSKLDEGRLPRYASTIMAIYAMNCSYFEQIRGRDIRTINGMDLNRHIKNVSSLLTVSKVRRGNNVIPDTKAPVLNVVARHMITNGEKVVALSTDDSTVNDVEYNRIKIQTLISLFNELSRDIVRGYYSAELVNDAVKLYYHNESYPVEYYRTMLPPVRSMINTIDGLIWYCPKIDVGDIKYSVKHGIVDYSMHVDMSGVAKYYEDNPALFDGSRIRAIFGLKREPAISDVNRLLTEYFEQMSAIVVSSSERRNIYGETRMDIVNDLDVLERKIDKIVLLHSAIENLDRNCFGVSMITRILEKNGILKLYSQYYQSVSAMSNWINVIKMYIGLIARLKYTLEEQENLIIAYNSNPHPTLLQKEEFARKNVEYNSFVQYARHQMSEYERQYPALLRLKEDSDSIKRNLGTIDAIADRISRIDFSKLLGK